MSNVIGYKLDFIQFTCESCGTVAVGKSRSRKYCDDCRYRRHVTTSKENKQREQVLNRESLTAFIKPTQPTEKPQYTLSEVAEAARKNGMTYGNYVYAWKSGRVKPPEKFPTKKKRGRKKRER
jgi:hypothetical protein